MSDTPVTLTPPPSSQLKDSITSFTWPTLLLLYLGPGVLLTSFYIVVAPLLLAGGLPPVWGLLIGALVVIVPIELAIVLLYSRQITGRAQLRPGVVYLDRLSSHQYLWLVPITILSAFVMPGLVVLLEPWLRSTFFAWLPSWFSAGLSDFARYSPSIQVATVILWVVSVVIIGPLVEELYFRGFLLPRTAQGHWYAPLLNALLFALYHFWQPYAILTIALFALPLAYVVWWKRNIAVSILAHCSINLLAFLSLFAGIVQR